MMDRVGPDQPVRQEVVLLTRPAGEQPHPVRTLRDVIASTVGMAATTAATLASVVEHTVTQAVARPVNATLDQVVPPVVQAIVDRLDLTELVLRRVDLGAVVTRALDEIDLTSIVIDRVDVNAIVEQADIEAIIDRVPVVELANYVVDEVDLPQIIRDSTSGIAGDAMNVLRRQGVGADRIVSKLGDRVVFRRKQRKVEVPGEPESVTARLRADQDGTAVGPTGSADAAADAADAADRSAI